MEYTVVIGGKPQGPFSFEELKGLNIKPDTFLRTPGMDDYKEAHEFAEIRELMGFSFQQTAPQYFAGFDQRLLACAIDYFLIITFLVIVDLVLFIFVDGKQQMIMVSLVLLVLSIPIKFIYGSIAESSINQASVGKKIMDIKVGDMMGNRLTIGQSLLRNIFKVVSNATLGFGYLYLFMNKKQQCLHDVIAGTTVIKKRLL